MNRQEFLDWLDTVPEDEPIFCLRAQDDASVHTMMIYQNRCSQIGSPKDHLTSVFDFTCEFEEWRAMNPEKCKVPD